jgi:hypothetical protein
MTDMQPQNFELSSGDSKILKVTVVDENGDPLPLAGSQSVNFRLSRSRRSPTVLEKELNDGVTIIATDAGAGQANAGRLDIRLEAADTEPLDGEYYHECKVVDQTGATTTIFFGRANIKRNLT